jgi:tyrosyl-DNA phosphodiesterase 2
MSIRYSYVELQEVTPEIYQLFEKSDWWNSYKCSLPHKEATGKAYYCMQV